MSEPRSVVVFRRTILPWSETFVASQQLALTAFAPVFVGYAPDPKGARLVEGRPTILLSDHHAVPPLGKALLKYAGHVPSAWRDAIAATRPAYLRSAFPRGGTG